MIDWIMIDRIMIRSKMKTAFFPFTYLSYPIFLALKTLFGSVTLYLPLADSVPEDMKTWEAGHHLYLCFPVTGNEPEIHRALREYRRWTENNALSQREFLRFQSAQASLSNDANIYQIRDEIRHRLRVAQSDSEADPLLAARLFLALSQEHDRQHMEIADDWAQLEKMESLLVNTLRGDGDCAPAPVQEDRVLENIGAPASDVMAQRIRAWTRLMLEDDSPPVIFATPSREAFELIVDDTPSADLLPGFDAAPFPLTAGRETSQSSRHLMDYLKRVATSEWTVENSERFDVPEDRSLPHVTLTMAIVPDTPAAAVFYRYSGYPGIPKKRGVFRHTLLALVER